MKEVKCEHCQTWTDGNLEKCQHCSGMLNEKQKVELESRIVDSGTIPIIKINSDDSLPVKGGKHIIRVGQLIFLSIISTIAAIASSTVH